MHTVRGLLLVRVCNLVNSNLPTVNKNEEGYRPILSKWHIFYSGGRVFDSYGIKIKGGRERKEGKGGGRGGEKGHLPFISIAYYASRL
jgi:hypothetical protein